LALNDTSKKCSHCDSILNPKLSVIAFDVDIALLIKVYDLV